ncbi:MAG: cytochrome c biogenesis protein ResB [Dehalococcoidia bacterium]|nr:cytochrome c biogenesis protein ResB [Dehalococcoidia bacterium]
MAVEASPATPAPALKPGGLDPLRWAWGLLTNVKFALLLVGLAAFAGLIGVVIPQMPGPMRANPAARRAWLELRREDYGIFTNTFDRLGFFDVFHTAWFNGLWVLIIVAVTVCTVSRFRPTWKGVHRAPRTVGEAYFERAHHRASFSHKGGVEVVEEILRKRRYHVERVKAEGETTYLFADRFAWSHYGTFLSHLALLMLLIGALLTTLAGFEKTFVLAETTSAAPVFDSPGPGQIFVRMVDAVRGKDAAGNIIDFRSKLEVRRGEQVIDCVATVNDPCRAFGYKIHQAAFFDDIARLRILGPNGQVVYDDVLDFDSESTAVPVMKVTTPDGKVLFDQEVPQMATDPGTAPGPEDDLALAQLVFPKAPGSKEMAVYALAWRVKGSSLQVTISGADTTGMAPRELKQGEFVADGGFRISFERPAEIPAIKVNDMPGCIGGDGATVQMPAGGDGRPYLFISGVDQDNLIVTDGAPRVSASGYSYGFLGRVEASGVSVKRDPGSAFIWIAVAMAMVGLAITFYVPRRRLWVKVTPERTWLGGIAERTTRFSRELRRLGAELGSNDALLPEDTQEP